MECSECGVHVSFYDKAQLCYSCAKTKVLKHISERFRGIRIDEIEEMNPWYSCVICGNKECSFHNKPNHACIEHVEITELEWLMFYDFEKSSGESK